MLVRSFTYFNALRRIRALLSALTPCTSNCIYRFDELHFGVYTGDRYRYDSIDVRQHSPYTECLQYKHIILWCTACCVQYSLMLA
uniref:Putative secreted protein n=1 Tax=Anopheles darlingi TaxID=43151 RepID=A0A2M4DRF7_ANODA